MRPLTLAILFLAGCPQTRIDLVGADDDGDGFHSGVDCDDADDAVSPGATEVPYNGVDDDCDADTPDDDVDGDGFPQADDCDDADATRFPDATEVCNGKDDDCDVEVDEGLLTTWYADADADGFGDADATAQRCEGGGGAFVRNDLDCDDDRADVHPGADEECNDRDDDCDGTIDTDAVFVPTWFADADGDGFGDAGIAVTACDAPANHVANPDDCDDTPVSGANVNPGEDEICNGKDDDCDGGVDVDALGASTFYLDHDGDGFGTPDRTVVACTSPNLALWVGNANDCDDFHDSANPDGVEVCNGVDDDCDGTPDDAATDRPTWYRDADGDGFGDPDTTQLRCDNGAGAWVANALDCDDDAVDGAAAYPGGTETCDGRDNDCNGFDDDVPDAPLWFEDFDEDGFGDPLVVIAACADPSDDDTTWVANGSDCDDVDDAVNPDATETCDGEDEDCDGLVDDGAAPLLSWYLDADGDGYGATAEVVQGCSAPTPEYVDEDGDCDDLHDAINPDATQSCSFVDDDCDQTLPSRTACTWGATCLDVLEAFPQWAGSDANFLLDPEGNGGPVQYFCDMTETGGRPGAGWMRIDQNDFTSSAGGWQWDPSGATGASTPTVSTCGAWGSVLTVPTTSTTAGGFFFRDYADLPHEEVWLAFDYLQIDTWDGEYAYASVRIDPPTDYDYWVWGMTIPFPSSGTSVCGGATADVKHTVAEHAWSDHEPLQVRIGSTLDQAPSDESFGIDNLEVWIR